MADNLDVFNFELDSDEMDAIASLDTGEISFFCFRDPGTVEWFAKLVEGCRRQDA